MTGMGVPGIVQNLVLVEVTYQLLSNRLWYYRGWWLLMVAPWLSRELPTGGKEGMVLLQ